MTETKTHDLGLYEETITGLRVRVLLVMEVRIIETHWGSPHKHVVSQKYQTDAGQDCYCEPGENPPLVLRCPTMRPGKPLTLIRQR